MLQYHYDAVKDWTTPPKHHLFLMVFIGLGQVIISIINIRLVSDPAALVLHTFFGIGAGLYILYFYGVRKGKPLIKSGIRTVAVEDNILKWNLRLFSEGYQVDLNDVKRIRFLNNRVVLTLADGHTDSFSMRQILNLDKRREFQEVMRNFQP